MIFKDLFSKQEGSRSLLEPLCPRASQDMVLQANDDANYDKEAGLNGNNRTLRLAPDQSTLIRFALGVLVLLLLVLNMSLWTLVMQFGTQPVAGKDTGCAGLVSGLSAKEQHAGFEIKSDEHGRYIQCPGDSSDAARQAGCSFDVLLYGWLLSPCFDEEMYSYHAKPGSGFDYGFYDDEEGTEGIPMTELMEGNYERYPEAFVSYEEHWQHCSYLLNTSVRFRWKEPAVFLNVHLHQEHMSYCLEYITNPESSRSLEVNSDFPKAVFTAKCRCYIQKI